jgi:cystathionine beta-lyase/cystathionine gamma-synthase
VLQYCTATQAATLTLTITINSVQTLKEWCNQFGVDSSLVRVWAGLEDREELKGTFMKALDGL